MVTTRNKAYNRNPQQGRVTKATAKGKSLTADVLAEQNAPKFLAGRVTRATAKAKSLTANKRKENVVVGQEDGNGVVVVMEKDRTEFLTRRVTRVATAKAKSLTANTRRENVEELDGSETESEHHDDRTNEEEEDESKEELEEESGFVTVDVMRREL
jgi:hypothetical protein